MDFEFQALLKRHFTRVMYFDATVMDPVDLDRVKVRDALSMRSEDSNGYLVETIGSGLDSLEQGRH